MCRSSSRSARRASACEASIQSTRGRARKNSDMNTKPSSITGPVAKIRNTATTSVVGCRESVSRSSETRSKAKTDFQSANLSSASNTPAHDFSGSSVGHLRAKSEGDSTRHSRASLANLRTAASSGGSLPCCSSNSRNRARMSMAVFRCPFHADNSRASASRWRTLAGTTPSRSSLVSVSPWVFMCQIPILPGG